MPKNQPPVDFHVTVRPDGIPVCTPPVARVAPGGKLRWNGRIHSGKFVGIVPGPVKESFTQAELEAIVPQAGPMPFSPQTWKLIDESPGAANPNTVDVLTPAVRGQVTMYKFDVKVGDKIIDPIIIVDDSAQDDS
jgi:hypothetical protein